MTQEITAYTAALRSISSAAKRKAKKHNLPIAISENGKVKLIYPKKTTPKSNPVK